MQKLEDIIQNNKKYIYKIACRFKNYSDKEDLFQVGCIGMTKAYRKYQESKNTKFTTFAYKYVLGEMSDFVNGDKPIKISSNTMKLNLKIEKVKVLLTQTLMREPSIREVSNYLELDEETVLFALECNTKVISMDEETRYKVPIYEVVGQSYNIDKSLDLKTQIATLSEIDKKVIISRYYDDLSQAQTASILGISQAKVSRQEQKALRYLKNQM